MGRTSIVEFCHEFVTKTTYNRCLKSSAGQRYNAGLEAEVHHVNRPAILLASEILQKKRPE